MTALDRLIDAVQPGTYFIPRTEYTMTVKAVENGVVFWDGIYDTGYETSVDDFLANLNRDGWQLLSRFPSEPA